MKAKWYDYRSTETEPNQLLPALDRHFAVGENATSFGNERVRKVLIQKDLNPIIRMGDERRKLIQFKLEWHQDPKQTAETIKDYQAVEYPAAEWRTRTKELTTGT